MAKTFRVAVAGSTRRGNYGHGLDTAWNHVERTRVVAVSDDHEGGRRAAVKRLKLERGFADYHEMLDEVQADVLAICPRWVDQHRDMALAAAERGVHVYVEKPFCRSPAEADEIVKAFDERGLKLAVAHPTRYSPKINTIRELIEAGRLGKVLEYRARGKEDRRGGGEDLWVLGTHVLDMIHAIGGRPEWCHARVTQDGRDVTRADVFDGPEGLGPLAGDGVNATFGMRDGSRAYFASHVNMAGRPSRYGLQIFGSKAALELVEGTLPPVQFLGDPGWSPPRSGAEWQPVSSAGIGRPEPLDDAKYRHRHTLAIEDLLDAIEQDRRPVCSAHVAREVVEMVTAVFESHRVGGPVELPLKTRVNPLTLL